MRWLAVVVAVCSTGCASSALEPGERLYREGDLRGALDVWRAADDSALAPRIDSVEAELAERAERYVESARRAEEEGRLAESILDYRLALALRPDDERTLAHVQVLARELVARREALLAAYRQVRAQNELGAAREALERLRALDPFEAAYEIEERRLRAAIAEEYQRRRARLREAQMAEAERLLEAGRAAFGEEELETAIDLWRRALLIDPDNERIQAYIARAERQLQSLERLRATPDEG